jgi:hypothetical protein
VVSVVAVMLSCAAAGIGQDTAQFSCPATLKVTAQPEAPNGWSGAAANSAHAFKTAKVYNGSPGKDEYDLKPDNDVKLGNKVTLSWNLKDYRDMNLFTRCYYRDTNATVVADLPKPLGTCSVTLQFNARNEIVGKSEMSCR